MQDDERTLWAKRGDVWGHVARLERMWPDRNVLEHLVYGLGVCPEGMIADVATIQEEMACETYKTPPVEGGINSWPALKYDAFLVIRNTHQQVKIERVEEQIAKTRAK